MSTFRQTTVFIHLLQRQGDSRFTLMTWLRTNIALAPAFASALRFFVLRRHIA